MNSNSHGRGARRGWGRSNSSSQTGAGRGWYDNNNEWEKQVSNVNGRSSRGQRGARGSNHRVGRNTGNKDSSQQQDNDHVSADNNNASSATGNSKFASACQRIQESVNKYLETHELTELSDDEEEDDVDDEVIARVLSAAGDIGGDAIRDSLSSGNLTCLICIHAVKRQQQVWSCVQCYVVLHLSCVQKWGDDSIYQASERIAQQQEDYNARVDVTALNWSCPKCRCEFPQRNIPRKYTCYCGNTIDPPDDPWLLPHSCGSPCGRPLKGACGHTCLMLCHPGPCAPCPQMVSTKCYCGQSGPTPRRCSNKYWVCSKTCNKTLSCGQHKCDAPCHAGPCNTCPRTSMQRCRCSQNKSVRPCSDPQWQCETACNKPFPCGIHKCEEICHPKGACASLCPAASAKRFCPCGKTEQPDNLSCSETVPPCGDTCGKTLACGRHSCMERCHTGPCVICTEAVVKQCECGNRSKRVQCSKPFNCETKCKRMKDCGKHACNKKCCTGVDCAPCKLPCNKTLHCGNHKCSSRCHSGLCFPCNVVTEVKCRCGAAKAMVPCGREKKTRPPRCKELCKLKTRCHHPSQPTHRCHEGDCPRCVQMCGIHYSDCHHTCPSSCHDNVPVMVKDNRPRAGPWEPVMAPRQELKRMPCPPCKEKVAAVCRGRHCVEQLVCSEARQYSCGRTCARKLKCGNHECMRGCHKEDGDPHCGDALTKAEKRLTMKELSARVLSDAAPQSANCSPCERGCERPRLCPHPCSLPCHPQACPPCLAKVRVKCHCGLTTRHSPCSDPDRDRPHECGNPCIKRLSCGHSCSLKCHSGKCSLPSQCDEKVAVRCKCGRRRKDVKCSSEEAAKGALACDEGCQARINSKIKAQEDAKKREEEALEAQRKKELEEFERLMGGGGKRRKRKEVQSVVEVTTVPLWQRWTVMVPLAFGIMAMTVYIALY